MRTFLRFPTGTWLGLLAMPLAAGHLLAQTQYLRTVAAGVSSVAANGTGNLIGLTANGTNAFTTSTWNGTSWTPVATTGPSSRVFQAMAGDPTGGIVLIGGQSPIAGPAPANATWRWNGTSWSVLSPTNSPSLREGAASAQLPNMGNAVVFGGFDATNRTFLGDTWVFDGNNWSQVAGPGPSPRFGASMSTAIGGVLLFGGYDATNQLRNDTWLFNGAAWTQLTPTASPPGRFLAGMAFDVTTALPFQQASDAVLLCGGHPAVNDDVWAFQYGNWVQVLPGGAPVNASALTAAFDIVHKEVVFADSWLTTAFAVGQYGFTQYGFSCSCPTNTNPLLTGIGQPRIGTTINWNVTAGVPNTFGVLAFSFAPYNLMITPPCYLFVDPNFASSMVVGLDATGTATRPLTIPASISFVGLQMFTQWLDFANLCVSNALKMRTGY